MTAQSNIGISENTFKNKKKSNDLIKLVSSNHQPKNTFIPKQNSKI